MTTQEEALTLRDVAKSYGTREADRKAVLRGIDLSVAAGELVVLLGANGSGKSTTLKIAAGMIPPSSGSVRIGETAIEGLKGDALRDARRALGMVFQDARLIGRRAVLSNVLCGTLGRHRTIATMAGFVPRSERSFALTCLDQVGLAPLAGQRASTLSGGQAQRVSIARALAQKPSVVLAGEPVASHDPEAAEEVMALLRRVAHEQKLAVLCVLHQIDLARRHADRLIGLKRGRVDFDRPAAEVTDDAIAGLYLREAA